MNISVKGEYALHAVFDLAMQRHGQPVKIADIAKRQKIPQKFLELILAGLKQGGFVTSRRGTEGGYLLARSPEQITVGDILRFVDSSISRKSAGGRKDSDPFADMWSKVDGCISGIIDHTTMAQLCSAWRDKQNQYVPSWDI